MNGSWWVEIIFLAMLAGFIALRLVSVLGRRTGHERPAGDAYAGPSAEVAQPGGQVVDLRSRQPLELPGDAPAEVRAGLAAILEADRSFEPGRFTEGAKAAYRMILEAYWRGDLAEVEPFMADDVAEQFRAAVAGREERMDNRIAGIDAATITHAQLDGMMAEVTVRFDARIAEGGKGAETVTTHDAWTFRRHVAAGDPNWLLVGTDADED